MLVMLNFSRTQNFRLLSFPSSYGLINVLYCAYQASGMDTFIGMTKMTTTITGAAVSYQTAVMTETQTSITAAGMMDMLLRPFISQLTLPSFCSSLVTVIVRMSMVSTREKNSFVGTVKTIHRMPWQKGNTPFWNTWATKI